ncbi:signal peptidase II [Sulfurirhabdus autotrophica]|uniref:Lipoprotein signal peptidase n=1 Tax=Sulfurirhabdus autotrophica TaxID=1706046 RepID=A0A4R3YAL3_9PROT|nr:signal peptidase II [Sulfurirhabdus autotrophica]TCV88960.1 signal peptidase II [Sulfurirhabdus autotrophica]
MRNPTPWFLISVVIIVLDQVSKYAITQSFALGEGVAITSFFNLVLAYNTGAAFSFLANAGGWQKVFFAGIAVVASVVMFYLLHKHYQERLFSFAISLILGGAVGNLIDRVVLGHVVDFLDFYAAGYHFPAFNVADSAITVGAALLIWDSFKKPVDKS